MHLCAVEVRKGLTVFKGKFRVTAGWTGAGGRVRNSVLKEGEG